MTRLQLARVEEMEPPPARLGWGWGGVRVRVRVRVGVGVGVGVRVRRQRALSCCCWRMRRMSGSFSTAMATEATGPKKEKCALTASASAWCAGSLRTQTAKSDARTCSAAS